MYKIQSCVKSIKLNNNFNKIPALVLSQSIYNKANVMRYFYLEQ